MIKTDLKLSKNFYLSEFLHPLLYKRVGSRAINFMHEQMVPTVQALRDKFGPITINDWEDEGEYAGKFIDSGLRIRTSVGAVLSPHLYGDACDCKFRDSSPLEVQEYLHTHEEEFPHILRLENAYKTETWLHIELCEKRNNGIYVFNP